MKRNKNKCKTPYCKNRRVIGRSYFCYKCLSRRSRAKDRLKAFFFSWRSNAKRRKKEFTITFEYFKSWAAENNYKPYSGLTIDRIREELGYIPGNIQILTLTENVRKYYVSFFANGRGKTVSYED